MVDLSARMSVVIQIHPDFWSNLYIRSICKGVGRSSALCISPTMSYLYKRRVRAKIKPSIHIWDGAAQSSLSKVNRAQNILRQLVADC